MTLLQSWRSSPSVPRLAFLSLILVVVAASMVPTTAEEKTAEQKQESSAQKEPEWKLMFDGKTLKNWKSSNFGGEGNVAVEDGMIVLSQGSDMTGITWTGDELPTMNYEVVITAQRIDGNDFFCGLTFEIDKDPCSLIVGGWGGGVVGISSLDGLDAANNETAHYESFDSGKWYKIRLRVSEQGLMAWIDEKQVVSVATKGKKISIRGEVEPSRPFGISSFATTAGLKEIKLRKLTEDEAKAPLTRTDATKKTKSK